MGRQREADMVKIDAMEIELQAYNLSRNTDINDKQFSISKKAKVQLIYSARARKVPIETILEEVRQVLKEAIDSKIFTFDVQTLH